MGSLSHCGPLDSGRSHRRAQRVALGVGQAEASDQSTRGDASAQDLRRDRLQPQLCSTEQVEVVPIVDGAPRKINETPTRWTLNVRAAQVDAGWRLGRRALELPGGRGRIAWQQVEQLVA